MDLEELKGKFLEKYGDCVFLEETPRIMVTLSRLQFDELTEDLKKLSGPSTILMNEADYVYSQPESIMFFQITIPSMCDFIVESGDNFSLRMLDPSLEHGDEEL